MYRQELPQRYRPHNRGILALLLLKTKLTEGETVGAHVI